MYIKWGQKKKHKSHVARSTTLKFRIFFCLIEVFLVLDNTLTSTNIDLKLVLIGYFGIKMTSNKKKKKTLCSWTRRCRSEYQTTNHYLRHGWQRQRVQEQMKPDRLPR